MLWFGRSDGTRVTNLPALRRIMPYVMRGRNESAVYTETRFDVTQTKKWLWEYNRACVGEPCTFLHLFLYHLRDVYAEFPSVDRFISGRSVYQRSTSAVSLVVKDSLEAESSAVKLPFAAAGESLPAYCDRVADILQTARKQQLASEKEIEALLRLPDTLVRLILLVRNFLDDWNMLPHFVIRDDPLYTSLFVANLGSLGVPDTFHHLYEFGTCSLFAVIASLQKDTLTSWDGTTEVRDVLPIRWTIDDRAADAFTFASAIRFLQQQMEDPLKSLGTPEAAASATCPSRSPDNVSAE